MFFFRKLVELILTAFCIIALVCVRTEKTLKSYVLSCALKITTD